MAFKVLTTPRSYGKTDDTVFKMLENSGISVVKNETGGIMSKAQMIEALRECDGVIVGVDPLDADVLANAPKLKAIAKYGVGVDNIDMEVATQLGIKVSRTVGANSQAVADYAFALMISVARKVVAIDSCCRKADWSKISTIDISGKTVGILGFGAIGKYVAKRCQGFDMKVLANDVYWDEEYATQNNIIRATQNEIYEQADFISIHLPLMPETRGCIGKEQIEMMKPNAIIINTARGGLIDEAALLVALKEKRIYGAGIDAFEQEPPTNHDWFKLENVVLGAHSAASTEGATKNMGQMATENLIRDLGLLIK